MIPRILVSAVVASVAMAGCGLLSSFDSGQKRILGCAAASCDVPVKHEGWWPFYGLDVADEVQVDAARPMTLTWKLTGSQKTRFHPTKGITFESGDFSCQVDPNDDAVYTCKNNAPAGSYKYTIRTKGLGSPPDLDPYIRNGS